MIDRLKCLTAAASMLLLGTSLLWATHNRGGHISYKHLSGFTYEITVEICTDVEGIDPRDSLEVNFGDGTSKNLPLVSSTPLGNEVLHNEYQGQHTFPGAFIYVLSAEDPNRNADQLNIPNSVQKPFHLVDTLYLVDPQGLGHNSSPEFAGPCVPFACVGAPFEYNPMATDPDGDSLTYSFGIPRGFNGTKIQGYKSQDDNVNGPFNNATIDPETGYMFWNSPQMNGLYNLVILVKEYRNGTLIAVNNLEIQIMVDDDCEPPVIKDLKDICVWAGDSISEVVWAKDPDGTDVTLSASGAPFDFPEDPAQFTPLLEDNDSVASLFTWQTTCDHVSDLSFQAHFKAEDSYESAGGLGNLTAFTTWLIKVVAPPPQDLQATALGNDITLTWESPYACDPADRFTGFSIWRREGSNPFTPDSCETGLAGRGYTKIASNVTSYTYTDEDLVRGKLYCYRILAEFADGSSDFPFNETVSIPSNEACANLPIDLPVITHVDVDSTHTDAGAVWVRWINPYPDELDTVQNPGPYKYEIYRSAGFLGGNFVLLDSVNADYFAGLQDDVTDTTYFDTGLNTVDTPYTYRIEFYDTHGYVGATETASSIYLSIDETDKQLLLRWEEQVPWFNQRYFIYEYDKTDGSFTTVGNTMEQQFVVDNLVNGQEYCFFIRSVGDYTALSWLFPLLNNSQIACGVPIDTIPPCPPELTVLSPCDVTDDNVWEQDKLQNELTWTYPWGNSDCDNDVVAYKVYFAPSKGEQLDHLATLSSPDLSDYIHERSVSIAGCYGVTAVDSFDNESALSDTICLDNCPFYKLPNAFTPDGDGQNDFFIPFKPYRFIDHIQIKIYNRWGQLVYETKDPEIRWDGTDMRSGKDLPAAAYFYICEVFEQRVEGVVQRPTPLKGFIQLIR